MPRTTGFLRSLAAGSACFAAAPAMANDDTQLWHFSILNAPVGADGRLTLETSPRARESSVGDEQVINRITYDHRLTGAVTVGGGMAFIPTAGPNEFRPHQHLILTAGVFQARTRVEQRFFHGADRMALRLRQRLQVTVPLARDTSVSGSAEVLYNARTQTIGMAQGVDSWRARIGVQQKVSQRLELGAAYLLMLSPRGEREDQWSHVPQVSLTWRL
ncbi:DUF2490 domain-containing protein [Croceibacterium mercuriale]|uniref:DUF2490 domain-containing protein n=1 Tax=Croceibacterium mercuriale TaxID=1572751 RepID=UPI00068939F5|nr:DUF2490 domain-containing protein [Croceibacterium mercuriale]